MQPHAFHSTLAQWFADHFTEPTEVQLAAWPVIAQGQHCLITAPTGSGKTLTAFMWALSQLAESAGQSGRTRVLYISPLKALNNDIQRNLYEPLQDLKNHYGYPEVTVQTRSGDTSQSARQQMLRRPPDILITTPESLSLLLTTQKGRQALAHVETLIMDEIHSIVDNRRGVQLMTNIERLADIAGEFQRIALSATVAPLEAVAEYMAGRTADGQRRPVTIIDTPGTKAIDFRVRFPEAARDAAENGQKIWEPLADSFRDLISHNAATLFFTNSRRLAEKITLKINQHDPAPVAYAHHGSLAREVRSEVEKRLKQGDLQAIVATNSLEMGIDIGHLDEVVMVQSPPSVAATLQRIGRAGHRVGEVSTGTLFPTHTQDFLEAAVLAEAVAARDIEPQALMYGPLDVLAQIIISICAHEAWPLDDLFKLVTRATPYQKLTREAFDGVIEMLSGRYAGSRVRELKARVEHDRINHTVKANRGALLAFYNSGGTIPDRGYFQMRHLDTGAVLGELDEEFVWEATVGDNFTLGTQSWQVHRITHNDVIVRPARTGSTAPPFWRSEFFSRSFHFSQRITQYLEMVDTQLEQGAQAALQNKLEHESGFDRCAAQELVDFLQRQRRHTETALPHRHHILLELVKSGPAGYRGPDDPQQLVIHTYWGARLNYPWALALGAAWQQQYKRKLDVHADNNAIVVQIKGDVDPHQVITLVAAEQLLPLLRLSLEGSGFFGARFRECAGRALLLTKQRFNQRLPLWMSRMQAKKLMAQVKQLDEFPVLLETWRTCLDDEFDLPELHNMLHELADGTISWSFVTTTTPSPFAQHLTFTQVSRYMYADDTPEDDLLSSLSEDVISQALHSRALRPAIERHIIAEFEAKRQRTAPGYGPESPDEWAEWLKERVLIPAAHIPADAALPEQAVWVADTTPPSVSDAEPRRWLTHLELLDTLHANQLLPADAPPVYPRVPDPRDALQLAREILSFYGPLQVPEIQRLLPVVPEDLLLADDTFICGELVAEDKHVYWCDANNFEILMRFQRASRRSNFSAREATSLPQFWAGWQRLHTPNNEQQALFALETLRGYGAAARSWLQDFLASRLTPYDPDSWDQLLLQFGMVWRGTGKESLTFAYPEEIELFAQNRDLPEFAAAFSDPQARYTFNQIVDQGSTAPAEFNAAWWQAVWQGQLACDSTQPIQQGLAQRFQVQTGPTTLSSRRRLARQARGWSGNWFLHPIATDTDPLSRLEDDKERVRLLLDRYGFINRDIVNREQLPAIDNSQWRWREAFRALRIMELSGEVITGHFFMELATPQFITPRALSALTDNTAKLDSFWVSAVDPVAPCGLSLEWPELPQRRAANYLSFQDGQLALVIENGGKELTYHCPWHDQKLTQINAPLVHLVERCRQHVVIHRINGEDARGSAFLQPLETQFTVVRDHKNVTLQPSF
ncbi:MAG: DEAD/DEAH box helicase [Pseudomonadota bacterium]